MYLSPGLTIVVSLFFIFLIFIYLFFCGAAIKVRTSLLLRKCSTSEQYPQLSYF